MAIKGKTTSKTKTSKKTATKARARVRPFNLKTLVIDREHWGQSALLNEDGTMCCLGFAARACGIPPKALRQHREGDNDGVGYPYALKSNSMKARMPAWLTVESENAGWDDIDKLASTNDDAWMTAPSKEPVIQQVFEKHGVKVFFVDKKGDVPPELKAKRVTRNRTSGRKRQVAKRK